MMRAGKVVVVVGVGSIALSPHPALACPPAVSSFLRCLGSTVLLLHSDSAGPAPLVAHGVSQVS